MEEVLACMNILIVLSLFLILVFSQEYDEARLRYQESRSTRKEKESQRRVIHDRYEPLKEKLRSKEAIVQNFQKIEKVMIPNIIISSLINTDRIKVIKYAILRENYLKNKENWLIYRMNKMLLVKNMIIKSTKKQTD